MNTPAPPGAEISPNRHPASFRDPSGFLYRRDGQLLRQVNPPYVDHYRQLMESGLYEQLTSSGLLIEHTEMSVDLGFDDDAAYVLRPEPVPLISYPYEWSFSALQDAALLTLDIQLRALDHGMVLKDASAFNVQFIGCRPVFIDTLSFERYQEGSPWIAYGQFCRHFLAPLMLTAKRDIDFGRLLSRYLDGIPLDVASKLLPWKTRLSPSALMHIHWHAALIRKHSDTSSAGSEPRKLKVSQASLKNLVGGLADYVKGLRWQASGTEWADYYANTSYSQAGLDEKKALVSGFLERVRPQTVWDFGANTGEFSRLSSREGVDTLSLDIDPACVDRNYRRGKKEGDQRLLPLCIDLTNPTPALGWMHAERDSLAARGPCDVGLALALVHHLAISNNTPLGWIAELFHRTCRHLIIEWVPKGDPQVQRLLRSREDIFTEYHLDGFEAAFAPCFETVERQAVGEDGRVLFLMRAREHAPGAPEPD